MKLKNLNIEEPPILGPEYIADAINYAAGLKRIVIYANATITAPHLASLLDVSLKTIDRMTNAGMPCFFKTAPSGQEARHYCGQEVFFCLVERITDEEKGYVTPPRILEILDLWEVWQKAYINAGIMDRIFPPEEYEASQTHTNFMLYYWYGYDPAYADAWETEAAYEGCPFMVDEANMETPAYTRWHCKWLGEYLKRMKEE